MEVLDVAEAMTALAARTAAGRYVERLHAKLLRDVLKRLDMASADREEGAFNAARRQFYRVLLRIGDNRALRRLFPSVGMHIIHVDRKSVVSGKSASVRVDLRGRRIISKEEKQTQHIITQRITT